MRDVTWEDIAFSTKEIDMQVAVYDAYGFTDGLVVAELARRGIGSSLGGRDADRLRTAAERA
jgi:short subunit dehydrogenase-like uncharacterized protein